MGGKKIYEREIRTNTALKKPISNWNIFGDVFVFQELSELCMVKCYPDKNCEFYKFFLPQEIYTNDSNDTNLPNRLIGYWNQNILLAQDNKIYNLNVAKAMQNYNLEMEETENSVYVSMNQIGFAEISECNYPVQFTSVDQDTICLVVASKDTNYATFLKLQKIENSEIHFNSMGLARSELNL
jgi:hypothetical protein